MDRLLARTFKLTLFGVFELCGPQGPVVLKSRKVAALLALLACAGPGGRTRDALADLLWGGRPEPQAQQSLRQALRILRRTLGADAVVAAGPVVSLQPGCFACDVTRFMTLVASGDHMSLKEAVELYKAPLLAEAPASEDAWGEWLAAERRRLEGLATDAMIGFGEREFALGQAATALAIANRAIAIDNLREDAHRLSMRALIALGRRPDALRHFDELVLLLGRELDIEADAETQALAADLRHAGAGTTAADLLIPVGIAPFLTACNGVTEELGKRIELDLAGGLSRTGFLRVVQEPPARTPPIASAATTGLDGRFVLNGTIRAQDGKLCVDIALVDTSDGRQLWSDSFAPSESQWSSAHEFAVRRTVFAAHFVLLRRLAASYSVELEKEPTIAQLLVRGFGGLIDNSDSTAFSGSTEAFTAILQRQPGSFTAMIGLAACYLLSISDLKTEREPYLTEAERLLRHALAKAAGSYSVHFYLGILHNLQGNLSAALAEFDQALAINPSHAASYARKGRVLVRLQKYAEAIDLIRYGQRLSNGIIVNGWSLWEGWAELELGRDDEAGHAFERALAAVPQNPYVHASLAALRALHAEWDEARRHVAQARKLTPHLSDEQRLIELNKGPRGHPLANRLGLGLQAAFETAR